VTRLAASFWLTATALLIAPASGSAQSFEPRTEYEELTGEPKPIPQIPDGLSGIVRAASSSLVEVKSLAGTAIPVNISWYEPSDFEVFADGRYLGFAYGGYEAYGYILVDRAMTGEAAVLATGQKPTFSPDGRFIAAAELSEAGYSNLEGVALWEVLPNRTQQRFFTDDLPLAWDWRIDRWASPTCASLSAISPDVQPSTEEEWEIMAANAPRFHYSLSLESSPITLRATYGEPGCIGAN
jgi:hypothetical protein